jgi:hypothetical protein
MVANTNVAVGMNADGRLEVFGRHDVTGKPIWHRWQTAPNGGWSGTDFVVLAAQPSATFAGDPTVARNKDGRMELFVIDSSSGHILWNIWQTAPNGGWSAYNNLDGTTNFKCCGTTVEVGVNADGRLELFGRKSSGSNIVHKFQTVAGAGPWSATTLLGDTMEFFGDPVVARNKDGRLEVFAVQSLTSENRVFHAWQTAPNTGWASPTYSDLGGNVEGATAVGKNLDGRLEVFDYGNGDCGSGDSSIDHTWQFSPGAGWYGGWPALGGTPDFHC